MSKKPLPKGVDVRHDYYSMGDYMQSLLDDAEELKDKKMIALVTDLILAKDKLEDHLDNNYIWD